MQTTLTKRLHIDYPIIQAPMAGGVTSSELVVAVSNSGGLGMIGAGYLTPPQLRDQIREIKKLTTKPFGVNVFIPSHVQFNQDQVRKATQLLKPFYDQFAITDQPLPVVTSEVEHNHYLEQLNVIKEEQVPVCAFTFGLPSEKVTSMLKDCGILLIGTATNVKEAIMNEKRGMDMVTVQGSEAGGHRGTFMGEEQESLIGLMSLIPQVVDHVQIPVIATGGIMDGRGMSASLCLGAEGVQMGTAFLTCKESGAPTIHKKAILEASDSQTILTRSFSGKWARGLQNTFIEEMRKYENELPGFPIQNRLTNTIRQEAGKENNKEFMSLWSGQSPTLAKNQTVEELISHTISETKAIMRL